MELSGHAVRGNRRTAIQRVRVLLLILSFALVCAAMPGGRAQASSVVCEGRKSSYVLYVPSKEGPLPAILLLHGAGDSPEPMVDAWKSFAKKEGIALIAPELPRHREFEAIAPQVFRCVIEDAKHHANLDASRLYVFGNSMGGYLAYDAAMFDSDYFAAVAVHAMGIDPEYDGILKEAKRKTPLAIYIGDHDPLVALANVRRTRDLLEKNGFPIHYVELKDHDHNYYRVSEKVNADAWAFLSEQRMR